MAFEMNMFWAAVILPTGLIVLIKGADLLVDGAVALAEKFGVSPLVIGLTVVAMGTSAPEVAAGITAAAKNLGDAAIGNVYGSNIANLALVGGVCALIRPIGVKLNVLRREMPVMIIVALLLWPVMMNRHLGRAESGALIAVFFGLITYTVCAGLKEGKEKGAEISKVSEHIHERTADGAKSLRMCVVLVVLGLAALALGADLTVRSAVFIGERAGLSEAVIGLSIIAVGTSLPELMTCVVAAVKGHDELSIGNLVGSNIFNTLLVVGTAGMIRPFAVNARLISADYWIMITVTVVFVVMATVRKRIGRISGIILLTGYAGYMVYLFAFTRGG